jgi:TorA maturation chaperone TorD
MNPDQERDLTEAQRLAEARANTYAFLSLAFLGEPTSDYVDMALDEALLSNLPGPSGQVVEDHPLRRFARSYDGDVEALGTEYQGLFVVPVRTTYVKPYESVYTTGIRGQRPMMEVQESYREAGFTMTHGQAESPDHAGVEMEFMSILCGKESEAWARGDTEAAETYLRAEMGFMDDHVLTWFPDLIGEIINRASSDFYRGLCMFLSDFLTFDRGMIEDLVEYEEA